MIASERLCEQNGGLQTSQVRYLFAFKKFDRLNIEEFLHGSV